MNEMIDTLNSWGEGFAGFSAAMLIQSALLIAVVAVLDALLRRRVRAVVRHGLWMIVLVKLVLPVTLSAPTGIGYWISAGFVNPTVQLQPAVTPSADDVTSLALAAATLEAAPPIESIGKSIGKNVSPRQSGEVLAQATHSQSPAGTVAIVAPALAPAQAAITWQAVVLLVWAGIAAAMVLLLGQRAMFVGGLIRQARQAGDELRDLLASCQVRLGMKRAVDLRISDSATSPAVCGLLRPVILIPASLPGQLDSRHLQAVMLHELIHVRRRDLWVNLAQACLQIAYFYNPLLWLANAAIRRIREQAVDEAVLVAMGNQADEYAPTLVTVARLALARPALSLRLVGVVESKKALSQRVRRILSRPFPKSARLGTLGLIAVITTAALLLPMAAAKPNDKKNASSEIVPAGPDAWVVDDSPGPVARFTNGAKVRLIGISNLHGEPQQ